MFWRFILTIQLSVLVQSHAVCTGTAAECEKFSNEYHYVFYFIHQYFQLNGGLTLPNKTFAADRLQKIATWLYDTSMGTHLDYEQKKNIAIWSVKYLLENQDVSWEEFKNQFLTSLCENLKSKESNTDFNSKMQELKQDANGLTEAGMVTYNNNPAYGNKAYGGVDSNGYSFVKLEVDWSREAKITGFMHCHLNNIDIPELRTLTVFSMSDFIALSQLVQNSQASIKDMGMYVTSNRGTFAIKLTNRQAMIDFANYIINNEKVVDKIYKEDIDVNMSKKQQIKGLLNLIKKSNVGTGIELYESDSNFKNWKKHYLDENNKVKTEKCSKIIKIMIKYIVTIVVLILTNLANAQQQTVLRTVSFQDTFDEDFEFEEGDYVKDMYSQLNPYVGTWKYEGQEKTLILKIWKVPMFYNSISKRYRDYLITTYKYIKNGVVLVDNLNLPAITSFENISNTEAKKYGTFSLSSLNNGTVLTGGITDIPLNILTHAEIHPVNPINGAFNKIKIYYNGLISTRGNPDSFYVGKPTFELPNSVELIKQ